MRVGFGPSKYTTERGNSVIQGNTKKKKKRENGMLGKIPKLILEKSLYPEKCGGYVQRPFERLENFGK